MPSAFSPGPLSCVPLSCISTGYCAVRQTRRHQVCVSNTSVASRGWGTTLTCLHSNGELHLTLPSRYKIVALLIVWKLLWITKLCSFPICFSFPLGITCIFITRCLSQQLNQQGKELYSISYEIVYCSMVWPLKSVHKSVYHGMFPKTIKFLHVISTLLGSLQNH